MKLKHLLISGLALAGTLVGCVSETEMIPEGDGLVPINLEGSILQEETRVTAQGFEDEDAIGLYAVNYENANQTPGKLLDKGNQADHVQYIFDEGAYKWTPVRKVYYKDVNTNADLYCYFPFSEPESVSQFNFEVQKDQSIARKGRTMSTYEASDFMWYKAANVTPTESRIKVKMDHKMAGAWVILQEGEGFAAGEFNLLEKHVMVLNTTRKSTIDLSTGTVTPVGNPQATGIVMASQADGSFRAVVVPQTLASSQKWFSITVGTKSYKYGKAEAFTYVPGKLSKFTIRISKKANTGEFEMEMAEPEIVDWTEDQNVNEGTARQYYCVNVTEPGTLGQLIKADKKNPNKIRNLKVSGKITTEDFFFMRDNMEILEAVNLKEAQVVNVHQNRLYEYEYDEQGNGHEVTTRPAANNVSDVIPDNAFKGKKSLYYFTFPEKITEIGAHAFSESSISGALVIPDDVKYIRSSAFSNTNISSVTFSNVLERIESSAFNYCKSLTGSLVLPETLLYIGNDTFHECSFTGYLNLPNSLEYIGSSAFANIGNLTGGIRIPDKIKILQASTFNQAPPKEFRGTLDLNNVTVLGTDCFDDCHLSGELIIPEEVSVIPKGCFWGNQFSSLKLPHTLKIIETNAFTGNWRLYDKLEIHEGVINIQESAFSSCGFSELYLPSTLQTIQTNAFYGCSNLSKIVCKSIEPPIVLPKAFDGVAKDNFTVEVPEKAVLRYQTDPEWGKFRRISGHHDFSISRNISRALNSTSTKKYILRAPSGQSWRIESKPDWITVTPSSGVGKTEVSVTFNQMTSADVKEFTRIDGSRDQGRGGKITFLLEGKDYRTSMDVEQYDYQYGDGDVVTLNKATKGKGVNLVFMADCYDALDVSLGKYMKDIQEAFGYYFAIEPYKSYKDYFNVYAVIGVSDDSGMGTVNTVKDAKFGSQYSLDGIAPNLKTCFEYAHKADAVNGNKLNMSQTLIVMVENTEDYGGICYMWGDGSAVAICPKSRDAYPYDFRGIVQHEAGGHGFGKLADEYIYHNAFIQSCKCNCCEHVKEFMASKRLGWYRNLELTGDMKEVGWSHLIFHPKYSDRVDIFEGGFFHTRGVFRSEATSCMNNNIPYYSTISRQAMVERIMKYAGEAFDLDKFIANDKTTVALPEVKSAQILSTMPVEPMFSSTKKFAPKYMGDKPEFE